MFIFFQDVSQTNMVQSIIVTENHNGHLTEKRYSEPNIEYCMGCSDVWDLFEGFCIREEVEISGC